jgi:hypothetical protein
VVGDEDKRAGLVPVRHIPKFPSFRPISVVYFKATIRPEGQNTGDRLRDVRWLKIYEEANDSFRR